MYSAPMTAQSWQPAAHQPPPTPDEIHVWRIDLAAGTGSPAGATVLSPDERERAARLLCEHKRAQFIAGRSALRRLLGHYLGAAPQTLTFRYGPRGKPALATGAAHRTLQFNFSNSRDLGLLAVATAREIGIDLEYRHRGISVAPLARHILSPGEAAAFQRLPPQRHKQALLATWTRKEAYVKALGVGLARSLKQLLDRGCRRRRLPPGCNWRMPTENRGSGRSPRSPCIPITSPAWRPRAATGHCAASTGGRR